MFCAICTSDRGPFVKRCLGRNDAVVNVCSECDETHPRSGRYSFDGGGETSRTFERTSGNRQRGKQNQ